jgi:cobalt/nickel transport system permease protein
MHMGDVLISPAVGGAMLAVSGGTLAYSVRRAGREADLRKISLAGVMGAFVFAAQMINFSIPGTGSSGHLTGGVLLAALLGPFWGFISMSAILLIQALLFADGGLLAYGCNVFNMGFFACFLAYWLIYKPLARPGGSARRTAGAAVLASLASLQLGAFAVVLETLLSGKTDLPFAVFVTYMQPIHLAIGLVEGLVTGAVLLFVRQARPELLAPAPVTDNPSLKPLKPVLLTLLAAAVLVGGVVCWFASAHPDGLEWSVGNTAQNELTSDFAAQTEELQGNLAVLPGYGFRNPEGEGAERLGASLSGLLGGAVVVLLIAGVGGLSALTRRRTARPSGA